MKKIFVLLPLLCAASTTVLAQVDFTGEWDHPGMFGHEDLNDRGQGPEIGDYMGLPLNAAGLRKAESYSGSWLSVPEHQCTPHPAAYQTWGPNTLSVGKIYDPVQRVVQAITLLGTFGLDRVVWMDGRAHPPETALHSFSGFSTGHWEGDKLVVETTHLKTGWLRRNGTPTSERAKMTEYFERFENYLLVTTIVEDPVYLSEPFVRTTEYELTLRPVPVLGYPFTRNDGPTFYKCFPGEETTSNKYFVPHYLPGTNNLLDDFAKKYKIPRWVLASGGASMFPEFMRNIDSNNVVKVAAPQALAAPPRDTALHSVQVRDHIWLITGAGGNVTVQVGNEGVLLFDTGTAAMAPRLLEEIRRITDGKPIHYIINTQWQADHTGGNILLSDGPIQRAAILAQENVGLRLAEAKADASKLVMDTFYSDSKVIYFNGEAIEIIKLPKANGDSNSLVFFRGSDVVVSGDVIATNSFPRFDTAEDGSINGLLAALNRILDITVAETRGQGGTVVIPGHGRLYDEADVAEYRDMVNIVRDRIQQAASKGQSLQQVRDSQPVLDYAGVFGNAGSDWTSDNFIEAVYKNVRGAK